MDIEQSRQIVMARFGMSTISQETLAIIGASIALAALILTGSAGVRGEIQNVRDEIRAVRAEARADREVLRTEARSDREALRTEAHTDREALRAEAHTDREALRAEARADREAFQSHILRLTEQQGVLVGHVESVRNEVATSK